MAGPRPLRYNSSARCMRRQTHSSSPLLWDGGSARMMAGSGSRAGDLERSFGGFAGSAGRPGHTR